MASIVVVGSLNMDLMVQTRHLPLPGETVSGSALRYIPGGKGANQAVAAARLGCDVAMIGRVGNDQFGPVLLQNLQDAGINTRGVVMDTETPTGTAVILVDQKGENQIVVSPAANYKVCPDDITGFEELLSQAALIVLQFEIPLPSIQRTLEIARRHQIKTLINTAPFMDTPPGFYQGVSILVSNEIEAGNLAHMPVEDVASAKKAAVKILAEQGVGTSVITLGAMGSVLAQDEKVMDCPAFPVQAVDTTAAGDSFIGGFVSAYVRGLSAGEGLKFANAVGALTTTRLGAQTSLPTRAEVDFFLSNAGGKETR